LTQKIKETWPTLSDPFFPVGLQNTAFRPREKTECEYQVSYNSFIEYDTFEDLYNSIRKKEVAYGLMNTDIAAYQQNTWNDGYSSTDLLAVIQTIPLEVSIYEAVSVFNRHTEGECLALSYVTAKKEALKIFRKKIKV